MAGKNMDQSSKYLQFATLLHQASAMWRTVLDRRLRPHGFSQATWRVLITLKRLQGCNQTELASWLAIEAPTLVRLLDRLENQGWVVRTMDANDRRSKCVSLTDASLNITDVIDSEACTLRKELLSDISVEELSVCVNVLTKLQGKMETLVKRD